MKFTTKQIAIMFGGVLVVAAVFVLIYFGLRGSSAQTEKVTLTVWGTDPLSVFNDMASAYKTYASDATVNYTQIDPANYDETLLKAFAAGTGPDLFEIGNHDLSKWLTLTAPVPATFASQFNYTTLENDFPTVIAQDFTSNGYVYALPLDLDTMAMYYNKNLFNSAAIVYPPKTWDDFEADVAKLRTLDAQGNVVQAGAAIGGSQASIANAPDLVLLLMLQNGAQVMSSDGTTALFNATVQGANGNPSNPGLAAFNFYLQFANPASPYYTWNDSLGDAVQNFIAGKTAILFDYASAMGEIRQKAPFFSYGIAPMPQPTGATITVNYPQYEGLAVSKYGQVAAAWSFILYMTTNPTGEAVYTKDMGEPLADRASIAADLNDPTYGIFETQALTAQSFPVANDDQVSTIINTAIASVLSGSTDSTHALGTAQDAMTAAMGE